MSPPPFTLIPTPTFRSILTDLELDPSSERKLRKVRKALAMLEAVGPSHPGFQSHRYDSIAGPKGEEVWESYVENKTPSAWRLFWHYGPERGQITLLIVGPHP